MTMTVKELSAMEPGRELDKLVVKEVYNHIQPPFYWYPSRKTEDAWSVVEWMVSKKPGKKYELGLLPLMADNGFLVTFGESGYVATTVPEAICKAAILAIQDE